MIVPSVRVQSRVPSLEENSLVVICFETNDLDVFKVHVVAEMVDMACNFEVLVKLCDYFFCAPQFGSLMTFLVGHSTQNNTVCNWFCTLCLISGDQNSLALWGVEKGCWWLAVVCNPLWPVVVSKCNLFPRKRPVCSVTLQSHWSSSQRVVWLTPSRSFE